MKEKIKWLLDFIFPPICASCGQNSGSTALFCSDCWQHCCPVDPLHRCCHCFEEVEQESLCSVCVKNPDFFFVRAHVFESSETTKCLVTKRKEELVGFIFYQWIQLDWPTPDFIVTFPHFPSAMALDFSRWLRVPCLSPFTWWFRRLIEEIIPEDAVLLILDIQTPVQILKRYESQIAEAFPKKCFLLSCLPCS